MDLTHFAMKLFIYSFVFFFLTLIGAINPILTGLFESKFLLEGGGGSTI